MLSLLPFPPTSEGLLESTPLIWSRRLMKAVLAKTVAPFLRPDAPLVLGYHRVVQAFDPNGMTTLSSMLVSREMLERHIDAVGRSREFVSLEDLGCHLASGRPFRRPVAVLTFDDGYRDVYEHAWPLLRRKGIPAGVFLVTDLIGTTRPHVHDLVYRLLVKGKRTWREPSVELNRVLIRAGIPASRRGWLRQTFGSARGFTRGLLTTLTRTQLMSVIEVLEQRLGERRREAFADALTMTWDMVCEMRRGGITIGSHTRSHVLLANEGPARVTDELTASRRILEQRLGEPIEHFAYPDGSFNAAVVEAVAAAGYRFAYTTCVHRQMGYPCLTIPRQLLWEQSSVDSSGRFSEPILSCQTYGLLTGRAACTWQSHA